MIGAGGSAPRSLSDEQQDNREHKRIALSRGSIPILISWTMAQRVGDGCACGNIAGGEGFRESGDSVAIGCQM
jgi:hypothetical protein